MAIKKKRSWIWILVSAVIVVGCLAFFALRALTRTQTIIDPERLARVERIDLARSVVATGKIEPTTKVEIKSKASGIIKYLYVNAGDRVREGQLLIELDKEALDAQLKEAGAFLNAAESKLQEMQSQEKTLRANLRKAQLEAESRDFDFMVAEYRRHQGLHSEGLISKSEFDAVEQKMRAAEVARNALLAAVKVREAELEQNARTINTAGAQVAQAQAQHERAEENLKYASIRSPINGVVLSRELEVGDAVSSILQLGSNATLIMTLGDVRELYVKGQVDETDIGLVKVGQTVRLTVDAYKNRTFQGQVFRIAPMGEEKDNVTRFEVRVSIQNDLDLLRVNMSANAEIVLEEHKEVLVIPESTLIYNEKRETFVEIPDLATRTGRRQVPVKTGISNGARTELISGLGFGDQLILQ